MNLFTIIIPTFNSAATLAACLESIVQQSYKDVEVLLIDGKSSDATLEIARLFQERIKGMSIFSEEDKGIYDAMNKGIDKATGKWLMFLGSDDSLYNTRVLEVVASLAEVTSAQVLYGNAHIVGNTGWAKDGELYDGVFDIHKLLNQNICHQAMFYRTKFVKEEIGYFDLAYTKSSDWDFNLRCWAKQPFQFVDITIAYFVAGGISTTANDSAIIEDFVSNVRRYFKIGLFHPMLNNPNFELYGFVRKQQLKEHPLRCRLEKYRKKILQKLRSFTV